MRPVTLTDPVVYFDDAVLLTAAEAWTWTEVPPVPYAFTSRADRLRIGWLSTVSLAGLRAGPVRMKVVHEPVDVATAAAARDQAARAAGRPAPTWPKYLVGEQDRIRTVGGTAKHIYLGHQLGTRPMYGQVAAFARHGGAPPVLGPELGKWAEQAERTRAVLARGGYGAAPVDADTLRRLRRHALWRGVTPPPTTATGRRTWGPGHIVDDFADLELVPARRSVRIDSPAGTCWTATFVASVFPIEMTFPDVEPWAAHADSLPFLADLDLTFDLVPAAKAKKDIRKRFNLAADQRRDAERAGHDLPVETAEILAMARELDYTIPQRRLPLAYGWARIRVDASSEAELAEMFEEVRDHYAGLGSTGIDVSWPGGRAQVGLLTEGIPGYPVVHKSWRQKWLLETVACALPHAASGLSHEAGSYRGYTTGRVRQAVRWDAHHPIRARVRTGRDVEAPSGVLLLGAQRSGKALALDTPVPTPSGWSTMGDLVAGDAVFGADGRIVRVTDAWAVRHDRPCYEVEFSDGTVIVADEDHQWLTETLRARQSDARQGRPLTRQGRPLKRTPGDWRDQRHKTTGPVVVTTGQIAATVTVPNGSGTTTSNHTIRTCGPLALPDADLLIPPNTLGSWLGDGTSSGHGFTCHEDDEAILDRIRADGYVVARAAGRYHWTIDNSPRFEAALARGADLVRAGVRPATAAQTVGVPIESFRVWYGPSPFQGRPTTRGPRPQATRVDKSFTTQLRRIGVLNNKHIPAVYLRASEAQRRALLAGLLDTDGYCSVRGGVEFYNTNERLARDVYELVVSLGYKPTLRSKTAWLNGKDCGLVWTVAFQPPDAVFRLARKAARQSGGSSSRWRHIVAVRPVPSVPVRCVAVDADDHQFLVGPTMIPTHNSSALGATVADAAIEGITTVLIDPSGPMERLAAHPWLTGRIRVLNLLDTGNGIVDPLGPVLIPGSPTNPAVRTERERLAREMFTTLAWTHLRTGKDAAVAETALLRAIRDMSGHPAGNSRGVVDRLRESPQGPAANLGEHLDFEIGGETGDALFGRGAILRDEMTPVTIIVMPGIVLPRPGTPIADMMPAEALGSALFSLGAHLGRRLMWGMPKDLLKLFVVDEAHVPLGTDSGRRAIEMSLRDGPKRGIATVLATHNAADVDHEWLLNACSTRFQFRSTDPAELERLMRVNRIEDSQANRAAITSLANGECLAVFANDVRDRFQWDLWIPGLRDTLNTTPTGVDGRTRVPA